jgi:hypothetical protein
MEQHLAKLLQEQYIVTEDYCNAQTALRNVIVARNAEASSSTQQRVILTQALRQHQDALECVQDNLHALTKQCSALLEEDPSMELLPQHMQRSRRLLRSIQGGGAYHSNGLPMVASTAAGATTSSMMVALTTLRTSIQMVQECMSS